MCQGFRVAFLTIVQKSIALFQEVYFKLAYVAVAVVPEVLTAVTAHGRIVKPVGTGITSTELSAKVTATLPATVQLISNCLPSA